MQPGVVSVRDHADILSVQFYSYPVKEKLYIHPYEFDVERMKRKASLANPTHPTSLESTSATPAFTALDDSR